LESAATGPKRERPKEGERGAKKRFRPSRVILVAATGLFFLVAAGLVLLRFGVFDRLLLAEASRRLEAATGLRLEAKSVEIDPFRLSLSLEAPVARAVPGGDSILREFTADEAYLDVPWSLLLGGRLRFQKVRIVRPAVALAPAPKPRQEAGEAASPPRGDARSPVFDLRIDDLVIENGRAAWAGAPGPLSVSLAGIDLQVLYEDERRAHAVVLTAGGGHFSYSNASLDIVRLDLRVRVGADETRIEAFELATERSSVSLSGTIGPFVASPEFEGRARVSLAASEMPLAARTVVGAEGLLTAEASIAGKAGRFAYEAGLSSTGLRSRELGETDLTADVRGDAGSLTVSRFDLRTEAGRVGGSFVANLEAKSVTGADIEWSGLDPDRILPLFPVPSTLPLALGSLVSGRLSGRAEALSPDGFEGSVSLTLIPKPPSATSREPEKPSLRLEGEIALRASGGEVFVDVARLSAAGVAVAASGTLGRDGRLDGRYSLDAENLTTTVDALRPLGIGFPPSGPPALDGLTGSFSAAGALSGLAAGPSFTAEIAVPGLKLGTLLAGPLKAELRGDPAMLEVRSLEGTIAGGAVRGSGTIFLGRGTSRGGPARPSPSSGAGASERSRFELEGIDLEPFARLLARPWAEDLRGRLSARAEIASGPGGLSADFFVEAEELAASSLSLPRVRLDGTYSASRFDLRELLVETGTGALSGNGSLDLEASTFSAALRSDGLELATFSPLLPSGLGLSGRAVVELDAAGDFSAPRGALDLSVADFRAGRYSASSVELKARSDGASVKASLNLPDDRAGLEADLALSAPYTIRGKLSALGLPLGRLLGSASGRTAELAGETAKPSGPSLDLEAVFAYPLAEPSGFTADLSFSAKGLTIGSSDEGPGVGPASGLNASVAGKLAASGDPSSLADLRLEGEITSLLAAAGERSVSNAEPVRFRLAAGEFRIDPFSLAGTAGSLSAAGTAGPIPGRAVISGNLRADIDAAILSPLVEGMTLGGRLRAELDVRGEPGAPGLSGRGTLVDGFVRVADFPLILNGIAAEVSLEGTHLEISKLEGTANGGPLSIRGGVDGLLGPSSPAGKLSVDAKGLQLEYPPGLRTTSDIALTFAGQGGKWTLAGSMKVLRGLFREDLSPGGSLLGFGSYRWVQTETELPAFIRGIDLDIAVDTAEPIIFRNNLADLGVLADVRVSGNPGLPLFSGRLYNDAVGTITFGERDFVIETARLDLLGQRVPDPNIEIVAHTNITHDQEALDIQLRLYGRASDLRYSLTSTPPRSKEDLSLIILTGQSLDEVRGNAVNTLTAQTLRFFASPIASPVTGTLEKLLKAEDVSFTPLLISAEADPGARFTFRKKISEDVQVIYSLDITSTQDQTLLIDYRLKRNFSLQAFQKDNGSYGASLRHSIAIRARPAAGAGRDRKAAAPVLSALTIDGDPELPPDVVASALRRLKEGRPFSYFRLNDAVDRLVKIYRKRGFANADIQPTVSPSEDGTRTEVRLAFSPGRPVRIQYSGDGVSSRTRRAVAKDWTGLLPEDVNLGDARDIILKRLHRKGYHEARVETEKRGSEVESLYVITVVKGPRYKVRRLNVDGNTVLPTPTIRKVASKYPLAPFKGLWNLVYDPRAALDAIAGAYRAIGHTDARVRRQQVVSDPETRTVDIRLAVSEGPLRMVRAVRFSDNAALTEAELKRVVQSAEGRPLDPGQVLRDRDALLAFCRSRGFLKAEVGSEVSQVPGGPDVDVVFQVREGAVHTVSGLEVAGNRRTRGPLVLKTAGIRKGDVFSFEALAAGQKHLYDLGVFRAVDISAPESNGESTGVPVKLDVREEPPLTFTYGLRYSSEEKLEGQVGLSMVNLFGHGRTALASYRQSARLWDARLSINLPYVFGYRADTRLTFSTSRETREAYISDEIAGSIGHELKFKKDVEINALYKLSRVREKAPDEAAFGPSDVISELDVTGVRDTRDDRFDAKAGSFLSFSLTGAPKMFGSGLPYVKAFTQYSFFRKAWGPVGWASNVRLGAVTAFGEALPASRLFYAGGGTSLRGFRQDMVGPIDPVTGLPTGGKIALLVNQELRVPIFPFLSGVAFYDVGNVYASLRSLGRFDLRQGVGAGLRASSPIGLIRFDFGFNPFRRPGEPSVVLFLSIGQAF
jgi:outer membrane protein assembly complex protein YaeT